MKYSKLSPQEIRKRKYAEENILTLLEKYSEYKWVVINGNENGPRAIFYKNIRGVRRDYPSGTREDARGPAPLLINLRQVRRKYEEFCIDAVLKSATRMDRDFYFEDIISF